MALSASIVWETRASGASDNNGGGFKAGAAGTDRSQQNAAQVAINNSTITTSITTTVITFTAGYTASAADVGNVVQMLTGTNVTAGFYEITAQTSTTWTVDRNVVTSGTTTNATGNMGGALATLGKLAAAMAASNKAYATGAFTSAATITFAQAVATPSPSAPPTRLIGYGAARGDATHATLTLQTNTGLTGISATGAGFNVEQIDVDCASLGTSSGIVAAGNYSLITASKAANFAVVGAQISGANSLVTMVEATGGTAAATAGIKSAGATNTVHDCYAHDNACPGIILASQDACLRSIAANNSGASSDGIQTDYACVVLNNTCHNNGRDGIRLIGNIRTLPVILGNLLTSNGGYGLDNASGASFPANPLWDGNAFYNNTSGTRTNFDSTAGIFGVTPYTNVKDVTLSGSPYVGPTTGGTANFGLNNTAGAGAAARGTAVPGTFPGIATTLGYPDMGAVQSQGTGVPGIIVAPG